MKEACLVEMRTENGGRCTIGPNRLIQIKEKTHHIDDVSLARTAQDDRPSAEKMLHRVQPKIFQVVRSLVQSDQEAREIGQVVALEVLESLHSYRGEGSLEAWAGGIAYRVTMRSVKKIRDWDRKHLTLIDEDTMDYESPEKRVSRAQLFKTLHKRMDKMPVKRRTPILLHLVCGYTVDEISEIMNVSPNTIKDRLKTAIRELRAIFDKNPSLREAMLEVIG